MITRTSGKGWKKLVFLRYRVLKRPQKIHIYVNKQTNENHGGLVRVRSGPVIRSEGYVTEDVFSFLFLPFLVLFSINSHRQCLSGSPCEVRQHPQKHPRNLWKTSQRPLERGLKALHPLIWRNRPVNTKMGVKGL